MMELSRPNNFIRATLAASTAIALLASGISASAQESVGGPVAVYNIPTQSLTSALTAVAQRSGLRLAYSASLSAGRSAPALQGTYTPAQAIGRLLAGTGLTFRFTGPGTITIEQPGTTSSGVVTLPGAIALDTINVVGGSNPSDTPYQTPGSSSYISQQQINQFPGTSAGDLLKSTPGVIAAMNHNGAGMDVNIRGQQGMNRVKVTIDGTQQTTSSWRGYTGVSDQTYVDPDLIAGIGVEKGPTTDAAGAATTGGVVSFRTVNAQDIVKPGNTFGARLRVGTSDNATSNIRVDALDQSTNASNVLDLKNGSGSAIFATTQDNFDFIAGIARRRTGNYFAGTYGRTSWDDPHSLIPRPLSYTKPGEEVFNSSADTLSALAKATFRFGDDQSVEFGYQRYESKFGETIGSVLTTQDSTFRQLPLAETDVDTYTARYRWKPDGDLFDLKFNLWATNVAETAPSVGPAFYLPPYITPQNRPPAHDMRFSRTWTYGADVTNTSRIQSELGSFKLDYGASYSLEDTNGRPYISGRAYQNSVGTIQYPGVGTRQIGSVFSSAEWEPTAWLKFNGGLRYDAFALHDDGQPLVIKNADGSVYAPVYSDKSGGRLNPSLGVTLTPVQGLGLQFYALYSEGYRPPSLRESIGNDSLLSPNPNLKPETAKNWELGINYLKDGVFLPKDKLRAKAAYFINNYDDYISRTQDTTTVAFFTTENLRKAEFSGVELSGSYDAGMFFANAALTYYSDFKFCQTTCSSSAMSSDYALNQLPPNIATSLTLGVRLFDEKLTLGGRINHAGERLGPLPISAQQTNFWLPYTVVDAFASYKVTDDVTFDLKAENLFDRYYIDALNGWMPSPGRTIRADLTAKF